VALGTGSSWSTVGTIGIALIGVGKGLGVPLPMVAGAIISGAYFGDKMSPLSDTTNLAPAVAGTDLFSHIRHMIYTTLPAYLITVILFIIIGLRFRDSNLNTADIDRILLTLDVHFTIHALLLIPPGLVILMVVRRVPPLPALMGGTVLGGICAISMQSGSLSEVLQSAFSGFVSQTGIPQVDGLLTRGGLMSMMETVALIICALAFGGIMEKTGMLDAIAQSLLKRVKHTGSLVSTTILSCIGMNLVVANQLLSIILPGRMVKHAFDARGLHPKNLSRCLEDAGTLSSPLIPWNSCGAFMHATLGVNPLLYLPFAFFNLLTPSISLLYGYTGITITPKEDGIEKS
jgi:NhaC family Na+:H+ antiporter